MITNNFNKITVIISIITNNNVNIFSNMSISIITINITNITMIITTTASSTTTATTISASQLPPPPPPPPPHVYGEEVERGREVERRERGGREGKAGEERRVLIEQRAPTLPYPYPRPSQPVPTPSRISVLFLHPLTQPSPFSLPSCSTLSPPLSPSTPAFPQHFSIYLGLLSLTLNLILCPINPFFNHPPFQYIVSTHHNPLIPSPHAFQSFPSSSYVTTPFPNSPSLPHLRQPYPLSLSFSLSDISPLHALIPYLPLPLLVFNHLYPTPLSPLASYPSPLPTPGLPHPFL